MTVSKCKRKESTLWQRRFWEHQVRDEQDYERHLDYIHFNPVNHGLVESVVDWPYSTFHCFATNEVYQENWEGDNIVSVDGGFGE